MVRSFIVFRTVLMLVTFADAVFVVTTYVCVLVLILVLVHVLVVNIVLGLSMVSFLFPWYVFL